MRIKIERRSIEPRGTLSRKWEVVKPKYFVNAMEQAGLYVELAVSVLERCKTIKTKSFEYRMLKNGAEAATQRH